ncbi:MAG: 16S rRNA (cytidine(1402)-2'-O)-methyltransferase [Rickettsiales bacterium]|jgi:16S rRNA (cytidine1402-2'-O)-methyltransferase|nr:16S rRNA (cytidine(1402)-2'-O)-methyltransferase [Rickettsiales bacterium]
MQPGRAYFLRARERRAREVLMAENGLYIVGTPIGNMGDMAPRAVETLKNADLVACEDTRVAGKLLGRFGIKTKLTVFAEHNEAGALPELIEKIKTSAVALITDSGMPGISDPGFRLVRASRESGLPVFIAPGPTAAVSALVLSGFPTDRFTFCGFFKGEKELAEDNRIRHTIIYYESPNRIMTTLALCAKIMPERKVAVVREITKIHEETVIGYPADLLGIAPPRGEIVLVIAPAPARKITDSEITDIVNDVVGAGLKTRDAAAEIAKKTGISKKNAYERLIKK